MKKYIGTGLVALGLMFSVGVASPAKAASLSSVQVQAVVSLLQSFGVDTGTIASVESVLTQSSGSTSGSGGMACPGGGTPINGVCPQIPVKPPTNSSCLDLPTNLYVGEDSSAVSELQSFLGVNPTGYFGPLTTQAVQNWQASHNIVSAGAPSTTGYGSVGPQTREAMSCIGNTGTTTSQGGGMACPGGGSPVNGACPPLPMPVTTSPIQSL